MVRVLFLHPDLGIGGAERLVVDSALALQQRGHTVRFLTNHHDPTHCFQETADGTLPVQVVGDWLPRQIFGRFYAFCAYLRMLYAALYTSLCLMRQQAFDVIICDQVPIGIPVLRLFGQRPKVLFYCHFPDQLLSIPQGALKSIYRAPLNYLEEYTMGQADKILVNSKFTLRVFQNTFRRLNVVPDVLYPTLNTKYFDEMQQQLQTHEQSLPGQIPRNAFIFLDINRYERKKNHVLALRSFQQLHKRLVEATEQKPLHLVIAGGYDKRVPENVQHFDELQQMRLDLGLEQHVSLLRSPSDREKFLLLHAAHCLLYTPANEHFGIVPLEGMYMGKPVIALNSGGPKETIVNSLTGFLCDDESQMSEFMATLHADTELRRRMGEMAHKRVLQKFSFDVFASSLDDIVQTLLQPTKQH